MKEKLTDKDKLQHFAVCFIASLFSPLIAIGLAIGKEYGDSRAPGNHWCWMDLLADFIGIVIGGAIHLACILHFI